MEETLKHVTEVIKNNTIELSKKIFGNVDISSWNIADLWYKQIIPFVEAVDWKNEVWLQILFALHISLYILVFLSRKWQNFQIALFLLICTFNFCNSSTTAKHILTGGNVYFAETINTWCRKNYKNFTQTNYFDKQGIFISVVFSAPLLCLAIVMLFMWLFQTCDLLVKVKRVQAKKEAKKDADKNKKKQD